MSCELCDHVFAQKHRIIPGAWGGRYIDGNVVNLCPNHHEAVHYLMKCWLRDGHHGRFSSPRMRAYRADVELWDFWEDVILPVCRGWMTREWRLVGHDGWPTLDSAGVEEIRAAVRTWSPRHRPRIASWADGYPARFTVLIGPDEWEETLVIESPYPAQKIIATLDGILACQRARIAASRRKAAGRIPG